MRKTGFVFASASLLALCISMTPAASDNMRQPGGMGGGGGGGFGRGGGGGFGGGGFGGGGFGGGFGGGIDVGNAFGQAIDTIDKAQRPPHLRQGTKESVSGAVQSTSEMESVKL